jgi:hypothetical protein
MKRMFKNLLLIILAGFVPLSMAFGQEKKNEQKIKVVINDGSGEKTVIDTTFTGGSLPEKLTLKDGEVIILEKPGTGIKPGEKTKQVFVKVLSDEKDAKKEEKKVIIYSTDSVTVNAGSEGKQVYLYSNSKSTGGKPTKVIITSAGEGEDLLEEDDGDKVIIIRDGKVLQNKGEKTFDVMVESDDAESDVETTKYVIAKDGLVVTVEGKDEAKVKELIKEVESRLGIKNEGEEKVVVKAEAKKPVKK